MKDIKQLMRNGEVVFGPWVISGVPALIEMVGYAGFDFVIIDCEHGTLSPYGAEFENCVRAAYAADITPFVRTVWNEPDQMKKVLNAGVKGVIPPHINTREDAELLVRSSRYYPEGRRSTAPVIRAARHGWSDWPTFWRKANQEILVMPLIEEKEGIENIEEIMSVEGIDGAYLGPFDLSQTMGLEGNCEHPAVWTALEKMVEACQARGKFAGNLAWNLESTKKSIEMGCQFIGYSTDITMIGNMFKALAETVQKEVKCMRPGRR